MLISIILLIIGFIILIKGADWMVSGASSAALNFKVSKTLIGLTIVAFGTSAPEFAVSISSLISGSTDMLIGNVVGSNIINILLLLGLGALVHPILVKRVTIRKELILLLALTAMFAILFLDTFITGAVENSISRADAAIFLVLFGIFMYFILHTTHKTRKENKKAKKIEKPEFTLKKSLLLTAVGLAGIVLGSQLVVDNASAIAAAIGVSDRIIALTIVALGTSLPELVTTITAAKRGESELVIGNIIGSNIFNICIVLALPIMMFGTVTPLSFEIIDIIALICSTLILYFMTLKDRKITRIEGVLMLVIFAAYYGYIIYGTFV